jgi:farnesyl-diphosphate farnesyltransferase
MDSGNADEAYQEDILPHVSRTFALTIPQLPPALRMAITNAYLLCRIADTIEDEPALSPTETLAYHERFQAVVAGRAEAGALAAELEGRLSQSTLPSERELIRHMPRVLAVTASLSPTQRGAIQRCIALMCYGMPRFQSTASLSGLARKADLDEYCYYVAGVVGDMLTELFCEYSPAIARHRGELTRRAISFAQGLQMTNILKDVWEDRARGACWLPQEVFAPLGVDLERLSPGNPGPGFEVGFSELVGIAHAHLRNALDYSLFIPPAEVGIRRFCLWAIGLAVLTLQKIAKNPGFTAGAQVKISRRAVGLTRHLTDLAVRNDWLLRRLFDQAARGLPLARLNEVQRPQPSPEAHGAASGTHVAALDDLAAVGADGAHGWRRYGGSGT